jgi:hypothetical protein
MREVYAFRILISYKTEDRWREKHTGVNWLIGARRAEESGLFELEVEL